MTVIGNPEAVWTIQKHTKKHKSNIRTFENIGLDYLGTVSIKTERNLTKRWIALFTCFTRAVHLEVADDLLAQSFVHILRRLPAPMHLFGAFSLVICAVFVVHACISSGTGEDGGGGGGGVGGGPPGPPGPPG
ncbi:unnamed protein product, partial [Acanthocheilonema viteae]